MPLFTTTMRRPQFLLLLLLFLAISWSSFPVLNMVNGQEVQEETTTTTGEAAASVEDEEVVDLDASAEETSNESAADDAPAEEEPVATDEQSGSSTDTQEPPASAADAPPVQTGPFIDLLGPQLLSLQMVDETRAQLVPHYTNDALRGKKVVGLYFSADW